METINYVDIKDVFSQQNICIDINVKLKQHFSRTCILIDISVICAYAFIDFSYFSFN